MTRTILHCDCNSFYVSCELCYRPEPRDLPVVVGGDVEARHGIVLAKSEKAKAAGIKTGHVLWQAKMMCPGLVVLPPDYRRYLRFSRQVRQIMGDFSDRVEPFGLDEAWVDLSGDTLEQGKKAADELRDRVKRELGITVSIGVANNKITAKLGSDYKKPDATTLITPEDYPRIVWPLPAGDLLYVGPATAAKLQRRGIFTIGELANYPQESLVQMLGKNGAMIWSFANGLDTSPVAHIGDTADIKSIGNSTTTPRDLVCDDDVKMTVYILSESVAERLREHGFRARVIELWVRDNSLMSFTRQKKLPRSTQLSGEIAETAMALFRANYDISSNSPLRSVGVRASDLYTEHENMQLSLFYDDEKREKTEMLESTIDDLRRRFGHFTIQRGMMLVDRRLTDLSPKDDHHQIFPVPYVK